MIGLVCPWLIGTAVLHDPPAHPMATARQPPTELTCHNVTARDRPTTRLSKNRDRYTFLALAVAREGRDRPYNPAATVLGYPNTRRVVPRVCDTTKESK